MESGIAKKILHICRVVYYMIRKGIISKRKLMMDLHLLLKRGKIAGRAIGNLMTFNHHGHRPESARASSSSFSSLSCKSMDPTQSFYNPREVEFSCSNTPSCAPFPTGSHRRHKSSRKKYCNYDYETVAAIAKAFDMLNNNNNNNEMSDAEESVAPSIAPSPMILGFGKSPRMVRPLRITDSPFPIKEDEVSDGGKVDKEAEEFIRRFYEQLRIQQNSLAATPEYRFRRG